MCNLHIYYFFLISVKAQIDAENRAIIEASKYILFSNPVF